MQKNILDKTLIRMIPLFKSLLATTIAFCSLACLYACSNPAALPSSSGGVDNTPPSASFTFDCLNLACSFDASTSADTDGNIISYNWDFGDGGNGSNLITTHNYASNGSYEVILIIRDNAGAISSSSIMVSASSSNIPPVASFNSDCPDLSCSFDASASSDSDGSISNYLWDFGDGNTGSTVNPAHTYASDNSYTISLTVTDNDNATAISAQTIAVSNTGTNNATPTAFFTADCTDLSCDFNGSASSDSDGTISNYSWDFGDGTNGITATPAHTYTADANYTIILTVTDNGGASSTNTQTLFISSSNTAPSATFSTSCTNLDCNFDASNSFDSDGNLVSYAWDFGDDNTGSGVLSNHSYLAAGSYSITLTITDDDAASSISKQSIIVSAALDGQALYSNKCSTCHGADALGGTLSSTNIRGKTAIEIRNAINTIVQMSPLASLSDSELQAIADYLATF